MKKLNWRHIRNTVAIATLVWPGAALIVSPLLSALILPLPNFSFEGFLFVCFCLSVGLSAYIFGSLSSPGRAVLHGTLSAGIALPTAGLLTFSLLSIVSFYLYLPGDWWLIRRFERNEAVFNELRGVVQGTDGLRAISLKDVEPTDFEVFGISLEQLESYRRELKRLGLYAVYRSTTSGSIYFSLDKLRPDTFRYYVYRQIPLPPEQVVEKIVENEVIGSAGVYRPIADDWYLHAEAISD